jgi:hypothetical protein
MKKSDAALVAVMANHIARAWHGLNVQEQRLLLWLVGQLAPFADGEFEPARLLAPVRGGGGVQRFLHSFPRLRNCFPPRAVALKSQRIYKLFFLNDLDH